MRLFYRGVGYDQEPTQVDVVDSGLRGQYRGQSFELAYPRHIPVPQPTLNLQYRGVAYRTTSAGSIKTVKPTPKPAVPQPVFGRAETVADLSSSLFVRRRSAIDEIGKVHQQNIQRLLQHRLDVARAKGDQNLISQLEREMQHSI